MKRVGILTVLLCAIGVGACSSDNEGAAESAATAGGANGAAASSGQAPSSPATGLVGVEAGSSAEICGNGLDDDRNGNVDDGCDCVPGATQACYLGSPALAGIGACAKGTQTCVAGGTNEFKANRWGSCTGSVAPLTESCNGIDDDCNGIVDEHGDGGSCSPPPPPPPPPGPPCQGSGLIFASVGDECIDDGGVSATGDALEVYCVNDIARFCLSGETCPWRDGVTTSDAVTCSTAGLSTTYFASARDTCGEWESHQRICCSATGQVSFTGC